MKSKNQKATQPTKVRVAFENLTDAITISSAENLSNLVREVGYV